MSLLQSLSEFRFNLETLDMLNNMGHTEAQSTEMMSELGLSLQLVKFILSQRNILNMALLRLKLYGQQNVDEKTVRTGLSSLQYVGVSQLLDLLYNSDLPKVKTSSTPPSSPVNNNHDDDQEESHFETFFNDCINMTDDASDVIKMSQMYDAFNTWFSQFEDEPVPSKDELKTFLSEKLGRQIKTTITHVSLK
jgi:hypothetical protein